MLHCISISSKDLIICFQKRFAVLTQEIAKLQRQNGACQIELTQSHQEYHEQRTTLAKLQSELEQAVTDRTSALNQLASTKDHVLKLDQEMNAFEQKTNNRSIADQFCNDSSIPEMPTHVTELQNALVDSHSLQLSLAVQCAKLLKYLKYSSQLQSSGEPKAIWPERHDDQFSLSNESDGDPSVNNLRDNNGDDSQQHIVLDTLSLLRNLRATGRELPEAQRHEAVLLKLEEELEAASHSNEQCILRDQYSGHEKVDQFHENSLFDKVVSHPDLFRHEDAHQQNAEDKALQKNSHEQQLQQHHTDDLYQHHEQVAIHGNHEPTHQQRFEGTVISNSSLEVTALPDSALAPRFEISTKTQAEYDARILHLQGEIERLKHLLTEQCEAYGELDEEKRALENRLGSVKEELAVWEGRNNELSTELKQQEERHQGYSGDHQVSNDKRPVTAPGLRRQRESYLTRMDALIKAKRELKTVTSERQALVTLRLAMDKQLQDLQEALQVALESEEQLHTDNSTLHRSLDATEKELSQLQSLYQDLLSKTKVDSENNKLRDKQLDEQAKSQAEVIVRKYLNQVEDLMRKNKDLAVEIQSLIQHRERLETRLALAEEDQRVTITDLREELSDVTRQVNRLKSIEHRVEIEQQDRERLQNELEILRKHHDAEKQEFEARITASEGDCIRLRKNNSELNEAFEHHIQEKENIIALYEESKKTIEQMEQSTKFKPSYKDHLAKDLLEAKKKLALTESELNQTLMEKDSMQRKVTVSCLV